MLSGVMLKVKYSYVNRKPKVPVCTGVCGLHRSIRNRSGYRIEGDNESSTLTSILSISTHLTNGQEINKGYNTGLLSFFFTNETPSPTFTHEHKRAICGFYVMYT